MSSSGPSASRRLSLGDAALLSSIASASTILLGVLQSKVSAVLLGPAGVGELAEVRQFATTVLVPIGIFNGAPFVALVAQAHGRDDAEGEQRAYDALTVLAVAGSALLGLPALLVGSKLMPGSGVLALALALLGAAAGVWRTFPSQALLAVQRIRASTIITIVASILTAAAVCAGTYVAGVIGQLAAAAAASMVVWPIGMLIAKRAYPAIRQLPRLRFDAGTLRQAGGIGGASLVAGLTAQGALSVVRWALDRAGGTEANGQYQAAWLIGQNYIAVILGSLGSVIFPRYAAATAETLGAEVEEAGRFVMRTAPAAVLLGIALRVPAVRVLYSGSFEQAAEVLGVMMAGDVAKALSYVQAGPLLYRGHLRAFVLTEVVGAGVHAFAAFLLVPRLGVVGAGWAYALATLVYVVVTSFVTARACSIPVDRSRVLAAVAFTAVAALLAWGTPGRPMLQAAIGVAGLVLAHRAGITGAVVRRLRRLAARAGLKA